MKLAKFATTIGSTPAPKATKPKAKVAPAPTVELVEPDVIDVPIDQLSSTDEVEAWALANVTAAKIEIIGAWVWLTYPAKPGDDERSLIKAAGFRWAPKRKQWTHKCGVPSRRGGSAHPRTKYGSVVVRDREDD